MGGEIDSYGLSSDFEYVSWHAYIHKHNKHTFLLLFVSKEPGAVMYTFNLNNWGRGEAEAGGL